VDTLTADGTAPPRSLGAPAATYRVGGHCHEDLRERLGCRDRAAGRLGRGHSRLPPSISAALAIPGRRDAVTMLYCSSCGGVGLKMARVFKPEWRTRISAKCVHCDKPFMAVKSEIKRGRGRCCSLSCAAAMAAINRDQKGAANNNWRGGIADFGERKRRYRSRHPEKHAAHMAMTRAIRRGELVRRPCDVCGATLVEGHHDDYSKPLAVRWLCKRHHLAAHGGRLDNHLRA
jgi:hypothetical protein